MSADHLRKGGSTGDGKSDATWTRLHRQAKRGVAEVETHAGVGTPLASLHPLLDFCGSSVGDGRYRRHRG